MVVEAVSKRGGGVSLSFMFLPNDLIFLSLIWLTFALISLVFIGVEIS